MATVKKATQGTGHTGRTCRNPDLHSHRHNRHNRRSRHNHRSRRMHHHMDGMGSWEPPYAEASLTDLDA